MTAHTHTIITQTNLPLLDKKPISDNFILMQQGEDQARIGHLNRQAVKAALEMNWKEAVILNNKILEKEPNDINAKLRLGKALLQLSEYNKSRKIFKEVLSVDPINQVALKNYEFAKGKKKEKKVNGLTNTRVLIKEPGTTTETTMEIKAKGVTAGNFVRGEEFDIKIEKKNASVFDSSKTLIGRLEGNIAKTLNVAKRRNALVKANFISGKNKEVRILIKCSIPVFKAEKQEIKPYIRKGTLEEDENDLEIPQEYDE